MSAVTPLVSSAASQAVVAASYYGHIRRLQLPSCVDMKASCTPRCRATVIEDDVNLHLNLFAGPIPGATPEAATPNTVPSSKGILCVCARSELCVLMCLNRTVCVC